MESFLFGGTDVRLTKLEVAGGPVRLAVRGQWKFSDGDLADLLKGIVVVERQFWNDPNTAFFVPVVPLTPLPEGTLHAGIGRGDAFALYSTTDSSLEGFRWELAHESSGCLEKAMLRSYFSLMVSQINSLSLAGLRHFCQTARLILPKCGEP
jgi:hypothetical protein